MTVAAWHIAAQTGAVLLVFLLAFFLLVRPQLKRMSDHRRFLASLKVGDYVVMRGGLIGGILAFEGADVVWLEIAASTTVKIDRDSIERRVRISLRPDVGS
jgi:preprotein translocase subunit YajC